jgi:ParB/RepB/Spo0J family partition protein
LTEFKSATNLENAFAQLLKKSTREVVKVFEFSEDNDIVMAHQLPDAYIDREDWLKIHHACRESGGQSNKDEKTGHWFFRFPKAAAPSTQDINKAPKQQPVHGEEAAAGQPQTQTSTPTEWKPEYPSKDAPVTPGYYPEFPIDRILSPSFTFRQAVGEGIEALMAEIHVAGMIIEPLIARPSKNLGHIEIGPGERRLLAARQLGMKTVPVIVKEMGDVEFDRVRLLENLARKDLTDMDLAHILQYLMQKYPQEYPTQEALGQAFGKSREWATRLLGMAAVIEKDDDVKRLTSIKPNVSVEETAAIMRLPPEKRKETIDKIEDQIKEGKVPSVRETKELEVAQRVRCTHCGNPTLKPFEVDGQPYCGTCAGLIATGNVKPSKESFPIPLIRSQGIVSQETAVPPGFEPETPSKDVIKEHEEPKQVDKGPIDTGMQMICPICNREFMVIHSEGKHRLDPIMVMEK